MPAPVALRSVHAIAAGAPCLLVRATDADRVHGGTGSGQRRCHPATHSLQPSAKSVDGVQALRNASRLHPRASPSLPLPLRWKIPTQRHWPPPAVAALPSSDDQFVCPRVAECSPALPPRSFLGCLIRPNSPLPELSGFALSGRLPKHSERVGCRP